jgi:hypothetical protein
LEIGRETLAAMAERGLAFLFDIYGATEPDQPVPEAD